MRSPVASCLALAIVLAFAAAATDARSAASGPAAWRGCCGLTPWPEPGLMPRGGEGGGLLFRGYGSVVGGSTLRHHLALEGAIPPAFASLRNPLPPTPQNAQRGAAVYEANCASCHGVAGLGDGPASSTLKPPPAHLGWLGNIRPGRRDPFMYWTIADGGARFRTAMPSYKGKLTDEEIWSVIGYIQARLPKAKAASR